jgi:hypothetical protein
MDTGRGYFEHFKDEEELRKKMHEMWNKHPKHGGVFRVGEIIEIKGSRFEVSKIINDGLKLKLLPRE